MSVLDIKTPEDMLKVLEKEGRPLSSFHKGDTVKV